MYSYPTQKKQPPKLFEVTWHNDVLFYSIGDVKDGKKEHKIFSPFGTLFKRSTPPVTELE